MLSAFIRSVHSCPAMPLAEQLVRQRYVRSGPLVLGTAPIKYPAPTTDRDRTVSRRSEPSSRTALIGEQPNPWDRIQPQDVMSRHRGAKPPRRCGLLGEISLGLVGSEMCIRDRGCSRSQGLGCSPIKAVRELGSERRETVRSLSGVGVGLSLIHI